MPAEANAIRSTAPGAAPTTVNVTTSSVIGALAPLLNCGM